MLIDKMENRILVGVVMFVGIMVLVGWIAINESARMESFEQQFLARSVERGAKLFAGNCSTCHGIDGRGISGRAPALNSPHFFGFDYTAEARSRLSALQSEQASLEAERLALASELASATSTRSQEINDRLAVIAERVGPEGLPVEIAEAQAALDAVYNALLPATLVGYPSRAQIEENPDWVSRLGQSGWASTLDSYIVTTLVHGRAQTRFLWGGNAMVAWGQEGGGPWRMDQIHDVANYIQNWDKGSEWTIEDALAVNQYPIIARPGGGGGELAESAGSDVDAIVAAIADLTPDPERGKAVYDNVQPSERAELLGCAGCHTGAVQAPATELTYQAWVDERSQLSQFEGYTFEKYVVESIVNPGAYIVPGYNAGVMPSNFATRVSVQDLADIVAYLGSYAE
jgi:mono/diheme cytochrome c family protein